MQPLSGTHGTGSVSRPAHDADGPHRGVLSAPGRDTTPVRGGTYADEQ